MTEQKRHNKYDSHVVDAQQPINNNDIINNNTDIYGIFNNINIMDFIYYLFDYTTESIILFSKSNRKNYFISVFTIGILILLNLYVLKKTRLL